MFSKLTFIIFLEIIIVNRISLAQITFQKEYNSPVDEFPTTLKITSDSGFIMGGEIADFGGSVDDIFLVRTDNKGDTLWTRIIGDTIVDYGVIGYDVCNDILQSSDGGFVAVGSTTSFGPLRNEFIFKTNDAGNILWAIILGGLSYGDYGGNIEQTAGENYLVAGTYRTSAGHVSLTKISKDGEVLWTKAYSGECLGTTSMCKTINGNYIITGGWTDYPISDIGIIAVDSDGNLLWSKVIGSSEHDERPHFISPTQDGGVILGGEISQTYGSIMLLVRLDSEGNMLWSKMYGQLSYYSLSSVHEINDGGFITAGSTNDFTADASYQPYLIRTGKTGEVIWSKTYGQGGWADGGMQIMPDGGYAILSESDSGYFLIRTDSSGNSGCNEMEITPLVRDTQLVVRNSDIVIIPWGVYDPVEIPSSSGAIVKTICSSVGVEDIESIKNPITIFPNPTSTTITLSLPPNQNAMLSIFNLLGEKVKEEKMIDKQITMDVSSLPQGLYLVRMENRVVGKPTFVNTTVGKFVKE
jgi:hypothetical protein